MAHIIIDGYNFIRRSKTLSMVEARNFELGRMALAQKLSAYRKIKQHAITIVFDAANTDNLTVEECRLAGIRVLFSEMGQQADEVIINMARQMGEKAIVVSSDRAVLKSARSAGAGILESEEFEKKLNEAVMYGGPVETTKDAEKNQPVHKRWITKKRGPSKRLPRAKRRALAKLV